MPRLPSGRRGLAWNQYASMGDTACGLMRYSRPFLVRSWRTAQLLALLSLAAIILYLGWQSLRSAHAQEFVGGQVSDGITTDAPPQGSGSGASGAGVGTDMSVPALEDCGGVDHQAAPIGTEMSSEELQRIKRADEAGPRDEDIQLDAAP
jgi:hypothetical protein